MNRPLSQVLVLSALALPVLFGCSAAGGAADEDGATASTAQAITKSIPAHLGAQLTLSGAASDCDGAGLVTVGGTLALADMNAHFTFSNNAKGTKQTSSDASVAVSLFSSQTSVSLPKQPSHGGVGGNPHIWVQLVDGNGAALSGEMYMGRCKGGLATVSAPTFLDTAVSLDVAGDVCSGKGGATIELSGTMTLPSVHARMIFRNAVDGPHEATITSTDDVALIIEGTGITLPKSPVKGGAGGNPLVSMELTDANGSPLSSIMQLGRCTDL